MVRSKIRCSATVTTFVVDFWGASHKNRFRHLSSEDELHNSTFYSCARLKEKDQVDLHIGYTIYVLVWCMDK